MNITNMSIKNINFSYNFFDTRLINYSGCFAGIPGFLGYFSVV